MKTMTFIPKPLPVYVQEENFDVYLHYLYLS